MVMSTYPDDDLRHPEEWEQIEGIRVVDADGWNNTNTPWDTPISHKEFLDLAYGSTVEVLSDRPYSANENMLRLRAQTDTLSRLLGGQ